MLISLSPSTNYHWTDTEAEMYFTWEDCCPTIKVMETNNGHLIDEFFVEDPLLLDGESSKEDELEMVEDSIRKYIKEKTQ